MSRLSRRLHNKRVRIAVTSASAAAALGLTGVVMVAAFSPREQPPVSPRVASYYAANSTLPPIAPSKAAPRDTVAFIGDSYSAGTGAGKGKGFANLVAASLKLRATNFAQGGTGYLHRIDAGGEGACGTAECPNYNEMAAKVIAKGPAVVIVSGGRNDPTETRPFADATRELFTKLRAGLPDATIIATSPVWAAADQPIEAQQMRQAVKTAVTGVGGKYIDIGEPFTGRPELITDDGVHPNNDGHAVLADSVLAGIKQSGVKLG